MELEDQFEQSHQIVEESFSKNSEVNNQLSKTSSMFVESNEELIYSTEDLIQNVQKQSWFQKFERFSSSISRQSRLDYNSSSQVNFKIDESRDWRLSSFHNKPISLANPESSSKKSSFIDINPLSKVRSPLLSITKRINNQVLDREDSYKSLVNPKIKNEIKRESKIVSLMDYSVDSHPNPDVDEFEDALDFSNNRVNTHF